MIDSGVISETISSQFISLAEEINTIFDSYRALHEVYVSSFKNISTAFNELPVPFRTKISNADSILTNTYKSVESRQTEISNQLYAQGLTLMIGNAEALTREVFRTLLKLNLRELEISKDISITVSEFFSAENDSNVLGDIILKKLEDEKSPAEKLNFQNMKQVQGLVDNYFKIKIKDDYIKNLHEFWQIRHIIIHNSSVIDQRFLDNLKKADISTSRYALNSKIEVHKIDYDNCFGVLVLLFENFDQEIERLGLRYNTGQ